MSASGQSSFANVQLQGKHTFLGTDDRFLALCSLFDDEDEQVYQQVFQALIEFSPEFFVPLQKFVAEQFETNELIQQRLEDVESHFRNVVLEEVAQLFQQVCENEVSNKKISSCNDESLHKSSPSLQELFLAISKIGRFDTDPQVFTEYIDKLALRVHSVFMKHSLKNDLNLLLAINYVLFEEVKFHGVESDYYNPHNSFAQSIIETRIGIPISLSIIYLLVAERVGLEAVGVPLPVHFLVMCPTLDVIIDTYHSGRFITKSDCSNFVTKAGFTYTEDMLNPASLKTIGIRMLRNIAYSYSKKNNLKAMEQVQQLINRFV